jgi:hypothetical protein
MGVRKQMRKTPNKGELLTKLTIISLTISGILVSSVYLSSIQHDYTTQLKSDKFTIIPLPTNTIAITRCVDYGSFVALANQWNTTTVYYDNGQFYIIKTMLTTEPNFEVAIGYRLIS